MFDVSWTDPARETVGERRNRKEQNGGSVRKQSGLSRRSSVRSSRSSESVTRTSLLNLFGPSRKTTLDRARSQSKLHPEDATDRRASSYTTESESSVHESPDTSTQTQVGTDAFFESRNSNSDAEQSSLSEREYHRSSIQCTRLTD